MAWRSLRAAVTCSWTLAAVWWASSASRCEGLALLQALTYMAAGIAKPREGLRRKMRQAVAAWPVLPSPIFSYSANIVALQVVPLLFQFRNLAFQARSQGSCSSVAVIAGPVPAQGLVDVQFFGLAAEGLAMPVQTLHARLMLLRPLLDRLQALDGSAGTAVGWPSDDSSSPKARCRCQRSRTAAARSRRSSCCRSSSCSSSSRESSRGQHVAVAGQADVGVGVRLLLLDLPADLLPLVHELRDLAGAPVLVEDVVPRRFQVPRDLDQRDPIQTGGDVVQHVGRLGVAERGQLLHLVEADGEDVVERRLVDAGQQRLHDLLAVANAVGGGDQRFVQPRVAVGRRVAGDLELPAGPAHFQPSARPAAVERRQIAVAIGRKAVQRPSG